MVKATVSRLQDAMGNQQTEGPVVQVCLGTQWQALAEADRLHRPPLQATEAAKAPFSRKTGPHGPIVCLGTQCQVLAEASCQHRPPVW